MLSNRFLIRFGIIFLLTMIVGSVVLYNCIPVPKENLQTTAAPVWIVPNTNSLPPTLESAIILYGKELIQNTAFYLGPKGIVARISNGMNCQNCHLDAGTRMNGNSLIGVTATYPKYRDRSGRLETIPFRIDECMERSLNGQAMDSNSKEMKAIIAYLDWLSKDIPKDLKIPRLEVSFIDRAADPANGKMIYLTKCQSCHGAVGEGQLKLDSGSYFYPPLWGDHSYNVSAGFYRTGRLAAFVKYNMPFSKTPLDPQLSDEEAWDVAAYISSQQRPVKFFSYDWPDINTKPVDYPFGPFPDSFPAIQHKNGPFRPIKNARKPIAKKQP